MVLYIIKPNGWDKGKQLTLPALEVGKKRQQCYTELNPVKKKKRARYTAFMCMQLLWSRTREKKL